MSQLEVRGFWNCAARSCSSASPSASPKALSAASEPSWAFGALDGAKGYRECRTFYRQLCLIVEHFLEMIKSKKEMKIGFADRGKMKEPCIRTNMLVFLLLVSVLGIWIWIFVAGTSKSLTIHIKTQSLILGPSSGPSGLRPKWSFSFFLNIFNLPYLSISAMFGFRARQSVWFHLVPSGSQVIQPYCVGLGALVGRAAAGCLGAKAFVSECLRAIRF